MAKEIDNRRDARIDYRLPIRIENVETGINNNAEMINYNKNGMYFETDSEFHPKDCIFIGIENSPYSIEVDDYECYRTEIMWRSKLNKSSYNYGYGVKYIFVNGLQNSKPEKYNHKNGKRRHQRRQYSKILSFSIKGQSYKGLINNISPAGLFMETKKRFPVGQILTLSIPSKSGRENKFSGQIVWTNNIGYGVRIMKKINT